MADYNETLLRFFRDDVGGILITDMFGEILYSDPLSDAIMKEKNNWAAACPPPNPSQKAESWDLLCQDSGKTYMVITSTIQEEDRTMQIHHLVDSSLYMEMYRYLSEYSKFLKESGDHDGLTGLYNRRKFNSMAESLFKKQPAVAVYNMDVNFLKQTNDSLGHEAGDQLLLKAAESLKRIEARNIIPFRVGGDEFVVVALHVNREQAEQILQRWKDALADLNRRDDGIRCDIACGFVYAEKEFVFEDVIAQADQLMYEDKKEKKRTGGGSLPT